MTRPTRRPREKSFNETAGKGIRYHTTMGDEKEQEESALLEPLFFHPGQREKTAREEEEVASVEDDEDSSSEEEVKEKAVPQKKRVVKRREREESVPVIKAAPSKKEKTAGSSWFEMRRAPEELRTDARVLEARGYANPKRFYKKTDKVSEFAQLGTVIAGRYERKKLTKRQQKKSLTDELLADKDARAFAKRKYSQLQAAKQPARHRSKKLLVKQKHLRIS